MVTRSRHSLPRRWLPLMALVLLAAALPVGTAAAQAPAPKATPLLGASSAFKGVTAPGPAFDLVESVLDFSPGATSHVIETATAHYLSVLEGELTVTVDGEAEVVPKGNGTSVPAGAKLVAEIGPEKITIAELDAMIEQAVENQLSPMAPFMTPEQLAEVEMRARTDPSLPGARRGPHEWPHRGRDWARIE